jgi:hypothetical protein
MEKNAASPKRPVLVPDSGEYANPFDAKAGIRRLMSYPARSREDVLSVIIGVVESRTASRDPQVSEMVHELIASLGTPQDIIETRLFAKALTTLPEVPDKLTNKIASADPTGTMAALCIMSPKTTDSSVSDITLRWAILSRVSGDALRKRNTIVNKMSELSKSGVAVWDNDNSSYYFAAIIKNEGWFSPFAKQVMDGMNGIPWPLAEMIMSSAPESVVSSVVKKEAMSTGRMINMVAALKRMQDKEEAAASVKRFMLDDAVPASEKAKFYVYLVEGGGDSIASDPDVRSVGMRTFASIPDQDTFDVALGKFLDGSDTMSVRELTGNIDYSVIDYRPISNKLERSGLSQKADPRFIEFVRAIEERESEASEGLEDFLDGDMGRFGLTGWPPNVRIGGMNLGKNTALLCAAILIAVGMPVSIVMMRTDTTGSELASRPDIAKKGRQIARMSETSEEYAKVVERAKQLASMPIREPEPAPPMGIAKLPQKKPAGQKPSVTKVPSQKTHAKPTKDQQLQAQAVTRQLVDAVVMLEHDPRRDFNPTTGAGGLMQLMPATWEQINQKHFQGKYPFSKYATNDWVNRKFGTIYLGTIKDYLDDHKSQWKTDQLPLMFACYFGGIGNVRKANFDPAKLKKHYPKTYDYMVRGAGLMGYDIAKL